MKRDVDYLRTELRRARETILSLAPKKVRDVLRNYHCEPAEYQDRVAAAVMAADYGEAISNAWDRYERFACPLCGEGQTLPVGMERHVGVDTRGRGELCKVLDAGIGLCRMHKGYE